MISKYNNLELRYLTNSIIDIYSYGVYIVEIRGNNIHLNTAYFNYSPTTSRHFSKSLGKVVGNNANLSKIITGYNKIKQYLKLNPNSRSDTHMLKYKLKSYINSLGYHFKVDSYNDIWLIIQTNC